MSLRGVTMAGRRASLATMIDTCIVERVTGETTDADGNVTTTYVTVYAGPAKRQTYEAQESSPEAGGATYTVQRYADHLPLDGWAAGGPRVGDVVTWTDCPLDPERVGTKDRVVALLHKTAATAYRLGVEAVL